MHDILMVHFLEAHVPALLTAVVQVIVSIAILWTFDQRLGISNTGSIRRLRSRIASLAEHRTETAHQC